ncbi:thiol reductant ABC exporter subunit CydC [Paenibacillus sp. UMB4589-SE434]|uniref:thiol reductant ABC exporter subunit CydC n=1 Tax=Paenibacillus sp. UMB4589-SE434 TaxID=3046314 RepID=UPI00254D7401|nr:thiol reductant ABC exporter subunit CydC [Paenibacillus sp. UMB4589-SE434]MDK8181420.1 thiol reductant ABC exporter subunit CydC [Paenibacillus sp. UMB4589-SE434]
MKREQWFKPYFQAYYGRFTLIVFLGVLTAFSAAALMFTSGYLISKSALRPENILMVYVPTVLVRTFGISRAVIHYVERLVGHDAILRVLSHMRVRLYRILEPQALFLRSRYRTGDVLGVLADDIEYLQNVYMRTVFPSIVALVMYAVVIGALGWFDASFAAIMALYIFVLVCILPYASLLLTKAKNRQLKRDRNGLYQKLTDAVLGLGDWVISGRAPQFVHSYEQDEAKVADIERSLSNWSKWRTLAAQGVVGAIIVSIIYWAGQQYADRQIDVTLIAAFVLVVVPLMDSFLPVSEAIEKIPQYRESVERLLNMGSAAEAGGAEEQARAAQAEAALEKLAASGSQVTLGIHNVRHRYSSDDPWSVNGVTLELEPGKKVAIIGRSGAGKSTLIKLIQGALTPTEGQVTINGVPASDFGDQIPKVISVLNQSPHLFDTTVGNNIRLGRLEASDEEIKHAAHQVKLGSMIDSLPAGYDTLMHETGQRFSGGERQRVALARILLQNTPVVILDEPTVGLDPQTERELLHTIFQTMEEKTLIWITHHLVGVEKMDEVIFVENGEVEMRGTHAELMAREPRYRKLYQLDRPLLTGE